MKGELHAYLPGWPGWWGQCPAAPGARGSAPRPGCCRPPCSCAPRPRCCPRPARGCRGSANPPAGSWGHRSLRDTRERGTVSPPGTRPAALPQSDTRGGRHPTSGWDIQEVPGASPPPQSMSWQEGLDCLLSLLVQHRLRDATQESDANAGRSQHPQ